MLQDILPSPAHVLRRILCSLFMATSKPTPNLSAEESRKWQQRWELHFETWASLQFCAEQISKAEISKRNRLKVQRDICFLICYPKVWKGGSVGSCQLNREQLLMHCLRSGDRDRNGLLMSVCWLTLWWWTSGKILKQMSVGREKIQLWMGRL